MGKDKTSCELAVKKAKTDLRIDRCYIPRFEEYTTEYILSSRSKVYSPIKLNFG